MEMMIAQTVDMTKTVTRGQLSFFFMIKPFFLECILKITFLKTEKVI
jgi:hypothetical protein